MTRLPMITDQNASLAAQSLLETTRRQLGRVPNLYRAMANGPIALGGYLAFRQALVADGAELDPPMRERIALLTAQMNGCSYCVAAHSFRGGKLGLSPDELLLNREARSAEPRVAAALQFAKDAIETRGDVPDATLEMVRAAGWSDAALSEIIAHIALNMFSNLFNHLARPDLDFPAVDMTEPHAEAPAWAQCRR